MKGDESVSEENLPKYDLDVIKIIDEINNSIGDFKDSIEKRKLIEAVENVLTTIKTTPLKQTIYFPAERLLLSIIGSSISGLWANNISLPDYFKNFSANYEVSRKSVLKNKYIDFGFEYEFKNGEDIVIYQGKEIFLHQASGGIQSLLPLLKVLDYFLNSENFKIIKSILIEEPELNLFPKKQKTLIEYIVSSISKSEDSIVITTHSPYILTVLDTFILAKNTFNEHPDLKKEINSIIPERNWIDYNEISVYEVKNDGTITSIKNEEFKSIDTNAIDRVSDSISEEFDKLTELRYAH